MTDQEVNNLLENWPTQMSKPVEEQKQLAKDIVKQLGNSVASSGFEFARLCPLLGAMEGFVNLGILSKDCLPEGYLEKAKAAIGDRPGINDLLMVKWFILRDPQLVREMVERTKHPDKTISMTCAWMLSSVSQRHPDLAKQIASTEMN